MKKVFFYSLIFISPAILNSCTSLTTLHDSWTNSDFKNKHVDKVVVFVRGHTAQDFSMLEKNIVSELKQNGINAFSADEVLTADLLVPPKDIEHYEWIVNRIQLSLNNLGIDAILFSYMLGSKEYINIDKKDISSLWFNFPGYWYSNSPNLSRSTFSPEYSERIYFETNLCDVVSGKIIWSAGSETINPYSTNDLAKSYTSTILDEFIDKGFVKK